jgi:multiple sugar transport system permease protein
VSGPAVSKTALPGPPPGGAVAVKAPKRGHYSILTRRDRLTIALMVGIPTFLCLFFIWFPTILSIGLSFTNWQGFGALTEKNFIGLKNYVNLFTSYPFFWPAVWHNVLWLVTLVFVAMPIGMFFAVLLDREMRGTRFYQSALFIPVVLSLALVGFIWQLQYSPQDGFINNVLGLHGDAAIDWLGNPNINLFAVLVAATWRHVGYVMVLYLAGLKSVDPTLREAAALDGASERQAFFWVIFPVMRPINIVIIVVSVIESLRAFDIVYVINQGKNGLELLSVLITNTSIGEASLLGFGSAIAVVLLVISLVPIVTFLTRTMRGTAE